MRMKGVDADSGSLAGKLPSPQHGEPYNAPTKIWATRPAWLRQLPRRPTTVYCMRACPP